MKKVLRGAKRRLSAGKIALRILAVFLVTVMLVLLTLLAAIFLLEKGPSTAARDMFVSTVRETSAVGFLANFFLTDEEIAAIENTPVEDVYVPTDTTLINIEAPGERSADPSGHWTLSDLGLTDEDDDGIILDKVAGEGYSGFMLIVRNPARVIMGSVVESFGHRGYTVAELVAHFDAVAGMNAGGFQDPNGQGNGSLPNSTLVFDGTLYYDSWGNGTGFAGFDDKHILHVGQYSRQDIIDNNIQYGAAFGPVLVANGVAKDDSFFNEAVNPRTAIGQRADGAVLMLVIDGRQVTSLGARYSDLVKVMLRYGAVNACNMDGGSSSMMWYQGGYVNNTSSVVGIRPIPSSWLVLKEEAVSNG